MSLDRPTFPNEAEIPQSALTPSSSGCTNPGFAIDDDPATAAAFGAPGANFPNTPQFPYNPSDPATGWPILYPGVAATGGFHATGNLPAGYPVLPFVTVYNPFGVPLYNSNGAGPGHTDWVVSLDVNVGWQVTPPVDAVCADGYGVNYAGVANAFAYFDVRPIPYLPRFLRLAFDYDRFVSRVRILQSGPGALNAGLDYETGLVPVNAPDVALAQIPLPVGPDPPGSDSAGVYDLVYDPPVYAAGIVFFPDAAAPQPPLFPAVSLYHLQVYESVPEGVPTMANATVKRVRVGCQLLTIYPWVPGQSAAQYLASNTGASLTAIKELGQTTTIKLARLTGGESAKQLGGYETDNDTKIKPSFAQSTMQAIAILRGDSFTVDPASAGGPEVQYMRGVKSNRAGYFFCYAQSTNGDGTDTWCYPKCKMDGAINFNLSRDQVTDLDFEFATFQDDTYVCQDGTIGADYEDLFSATNTTTLHS